MSIKDIKEKIFYIVIGTVIPIAINMIIGKGSQINDLKDDLNEKHNKITTEIQIMNEKDKNRDTILEDMNHKIQKLEESRDNLSDYYVTRAEFNRVIENQQKTIDKIDKNVEKIVERVMYK